MGEDSDEDRASPIVSEFPLPCSQPAARKRGEESSGEESDEDWANPMNFF